MTDLPPPHGQHLQAAQGWLELGNPWEANGELEKIDAKHRGHPEVLQLRCTIFVRAEMWESCLEIATALTKMRPDAQFGWVHTFVSLRRLKRFEEALDTLTAATERFGKSPTLELQKFFCLGMLERNLEAKAALMCAFQLENENGTDDKLIEQLRIDPDLEAVLTLMKPEGRPDRQSRH